MKLNPVLLAITALNAGILALTFVQTRPASAAPVADDGILRGKGLQIVDDHGKVRASIQILPASKQQDGTMSTESVLLRLITEKGRPSVKIGASEQKSGMSLTGPTGTNNTYVQAIADGTSSVVVVKNENGSEQKISP